MASLAPSDAPPSYETATGSSSAANRISTDGPAARTARNGIPPEHRRSMEDEHRELPPGWVRSFDPGEGHQFFVDTRADPPRSIWVHPYDDPDFLATLSPEERKKHTRLHRTMTLDDVAAEDSDDEGHHTAQLPPRAEPAPTGVHKFGRKLKDKLTNSTHEQREQERKKREEQERKAYAAHLRARQALVRAMETGQPQLLGKDAQGRDVYIEPPSTTGYGIPGGGYGYNPYSQGPYARQAPYGDPNARYIRPAGPYGRPYGYGYGGGYGGGFGAPVAAGLLGGALLGGLLF